MHQLYSSQAEFKNLGTAFLELHVSETKSSRFTLKSWKHTEPTEFPLDNKNKNISVIISKSRRPKNLRRQENPQTTYPKASKKQRKEALDMAGAGRSPSQLRRRAIESKPDKSQPEAGKAPPRRSEGKNQGRRAKG